jgi:hypothetical protein
MFVTKFEFINAIKNSVIILAETWQPVPKTGKRVWEVSVISPWPVRQNDY